MMLLAIFAALITVTMSDFEGPVNEGGRTLGCAVFTVTEAGDTTRVRRVCEPWVGAGDSLALYNFGQDWAATHNRFENKMIQHQAAVNESARGELDDALTAFIDAIGALESQPTLGQVSTLWTSAFAGVSWIDSALLGDWYAVEIWGAGSNGTTLATWVRNHWDEF